MSHRRLPDSADSAHGGTFQVRHHVLVGFEVDPFSTFGAEEHLGCSPPASLRSTRVDGVGETAVQIHGVANGDWL